MRPTRYINAAPCVTDTAGQETAAWVPVTWPNTARALDVMLASVEPRPSRRASTSSLATSRGPTLLVLNTLGPKP